LKIRRGEINLYVRDLDRAARFYGDALDFELIESEDSFRKLQHPGFVLTLFKSKGQGHEEPVGQAPSMTADMIVDDIDTAVVRITACGGTVEAIRAYEEGRFTLFRDPDGINWELISPRDPEE
jgi:catechol 2,3-dioxygenase-like lactoylglutathione lyase family enzyme